MVDLLDPPIQSRRSLEMVLMHHLKMVTTDWSESRRQDAFELFGYMQKIDSLSWPITFIWLLCITISIGSMLTLAIGALFSLHAPIPISVFACIWSLALLTGIGNSVRIRRKRTRLIEEMDEMMGTDPDYWVSIQQTIGEVVKQTGCQVWPFP